MAVNGMTGADIGDARGATPYVVAVANLSEHSRHPGAVDVFQGALQLRVAK